MFTKEWRDHVMKFSLILGLVGVFISLILYLIDFSWVISGWTSLIMLTINIGVTVYAGNRWKKMSQGYLSFKDGFVTVFAIFAMAGIIKTGYEITLYNVIDPELPAILEEMSKDTTYDLLTSFGVEEEEIDKQIKQLDGMAENFTPLRMILGYLYLWLFYAIGAAIVGLIIQKKRPAILEE